MKNDTQTHGQIITDAVERYCDAREAKVGRTSRTAAAKLELIEAIDQLADSIPQDIQDLV